MTKTTSRYTVGNIVGVIACMLVAVGMVLWSIFGEHSGRFERSAGFIRVFFTVSAVILGWTAVKAIRSRRR